MPWMVLPLLGPFATTKVIVLGFSESSILKVPSSTSPPTVAVYFPLESTRPTDLRTLSGYASPAFTAESEVQRPFNAARFSFAGSAHSPNDATETTINTVRLLTSYSSTKVNDLGVQTRRNPVLQAQVRTQLRPFQSTQESRWAIATDWQSQRTLRNPTVSSPAISPNEVPALPRAYQRYSS